MDKKGLGFMATFHICCWTRDYWPWLWTVIEGKRERERETHTHTHIHWRADVTFLCQCLEGASVLRHERDIILYTIVSTVSLCTRRKSQSPPSPGSKIPSRLLKQCVLHHMIHCEPPSVRISRSKRYVRISERHQRNSETVLSGSKNTVNIISRSSSPTKAFNRARISFLLCQNSGSLDLSSVPKFLSVCDVSRAFRESRCCVFERSS